MTREEAVKYIKSRCIGSASECDGTKWSDAMWTAIEALSADSQTGEVDAVAIYEKAKHDLEHNKITLGEYEKRIEPLKHLYYDRPTGEWIEQESDHIEKIYLCSNCKNYEAWGETEKTPFCPQCGARMKGADDAID